MRFNTSHFESPSRSLMTAILRELETAGRRSGGLLAAAGSMPSGSDSVRATVLDVLLRAVGLPTGYPQATFCLWLNEQGWLDEVQAQVERAGKVLLAAQKNAARRLRWNTLCEGGRQQTYDAFAGHLRSVRSDELLVLLVDSESPITGETGDDATDAQNRKRHLIDQDGWPLKDASSEQIHLMAQCMETWIVADADALTGFYGKGFARNSLPRRQNLEDHAKTGLYSALERATSKTQKGTYGKIKHASRLLELIDPTKVAARCPRFATFTKWLSKQIEEA